MSEPSIPEDNTQVGTEAPLQDSPAPDNAVCREGPLPQADTTGQVNFKFADDVLKALVEAIIYVAPEPVQLDAIAKSLDGEDRERIRTKLQELIAEFERPEHGIQIRQVASGYKFSSKAEHHDVIRRYVKSLKPPIRLSKPALETLAVIAYRQPVTLPEMEEIRGVDCAGVIHTLLEKKLVITAGRKNVVGRPILYKTSRDFLLQFGLKDIGELPSLREFEEMARQAMGSELAAEAASPQPPGSVDDETAPLSSAEAVSSQPSAVSRENRESEPVPVTSDEPERSTMDENKRPSGGPLADS